MGTSHTRMQAFHAQYLAVRDVVSASAMLSAIPIVPEVRLYEYFVLVCSRFIMIFQDESYDVGYCIVVFPVVRYRVVPLGTVVANIR